MKNRLNNYSNDSEYLTAFGVKASSIDIDNLIEHAKPEFVRDEFITLNKMGFMKQSMDEFSEDFIELAKNAKKPVLELGSAFGYFTIEALKHNIDIIAADLSAEHLEILLKNAPKDKLDKLHVVQGFFPTDLDFPKKSLSVVLAARVLHFLKGDVIEKGLDKIHGWLEDGGSFVCTNCSTYHITVKEALLDSFVAREEKGEKWFGTTNNYRGAKPSHAPHLPNFFNAFNVNQMRKLLPQHGFEIQKIKLFDHPTDNQSNNQGHVGFVATKV